LVLFKCTIWDDVRTYLTQDINPKEKTALIVAINHFKEKKEKVNFSKSLDKP